MVNGAEMYADYIKPFKEEYNKINKQIQEVTETKKNCLELLKPYKDIIKEKSNFRLSYIKNVTTLQEIVFNSDYKDEETIAKIKSYILTIANCNDKLEELIPLLNKANLPVIDRSTHTFICETFNEEIFNLIFTGYEFDMGFKLSTIFAKRKSRMIFDKQGRTELKKIIDWGATNKRKQELIDAGITPYAVTKRDENGKILEDNGGEKYMCYHTGEHRYFLQWNNHKCMVTNRTQFCLEFACHSVIRRFTEYMKQNPDAHLNFVRVYNK